MMELYLEYERLKFVAEEKLFPLEVDLDALNVVKEKLFRGKIVDPEFAKEIIDRQSAWRRVVCLAINSGISTPGMSSSLAYFDSYRRERLPANLVQAQRDYFGAHTYERVDMEGSFHTEWFKIAKQLTN
ncbi:hypothetical protein Q3G72_015802 [Acer saccharum]|nr:hypothetical protein Q3G72_015802 [Acer saccharum]